MATLTDAQRAAGWKKYVLSDIVEIIGGGTPKTSNPEYWNGDIPWLSVTDFSGDSRYVYDTEKKITQDGLENSSTKLLLKDDIIISARGTVGELAQLSSPMAFNQSCFGIRAIPDKLNQSYLYYLLRTVIEELRQNSHGSIFSTITRKTFDIIEVIIPPHEEQERIVGILGSLDDKIEANNCIIRTVSYIVVNIVDNFNMFTDIPNGVLSDIIEFSPRVRKPQGKEEYQYIDMNALPNQGAVTSNILKKGSWTGAKFENGDTLLARITPCLENGKAALAMGLGSEPGCGSTEFIVMRAKSKDFLMLPYGISRSEPFRERAIALMSGSTGRQRVKWQDLAALPIRIPSEEELARIGNIRSFFRQLENLRDENIALSNMRNLLIKKLIG